MCARLPRTYFKKNSRKENRLYATHGIFLLRVEISSCEETIDKALPELSSRCAVMASTASTTGEEEDEAAMVRSKFLLLFGDPNLVRKMTRDVRNRRKAAKKIRSRIKLPFVSYFPQAALAAAAALAFAFAAADRDLAGSTR